MSASLSALANQFQAASHALTTGPNDSQGALSSRLPHDESSASYRTSESGDAVEESVSELALARTGVNTQGVETMLSLMMSRLENVERNQVRLGGELERVREEVKNLKDRNPANPVQNGSAGYFGNQHNEKAKMKEKEPEITVVGEEGQSTSEDEWQKRVESLERKVEAILETLKIE